MPNNIDFCELESEKFWSFPASYDEKRKKAEAINMVFSGDYLGSRKIDGAYYRFCKNQNGEMFLQGRSRSVTGNFLNKIDWVPHLLPFFEALPTGTCLLGEIYFPDKEGSYNTSSVMGCKVDKAITRQKEDKLHYYIFDVWAFDNKNLLNTKAEDRFKLLEQIHYTYRSPYIEFAKYFEGPELWKKYQEILAIGGEGVVITKKDSIPAPGKRTAKKTLKLKKELKETLDVVVIGANPPTRLYSGKEIESWQYWQSTTTGEMLSGDYYKAYFNGENIEPITRMYYMRGAGSLKIGAYKDGKMVQIGSLSGLEDEVLLNWKDYVGKVAEITAMEIMETEGLRHSRLVGWRLDKAARECQWELIFGK